jgi:hypothetical protein
VSRFPGIVGGVVSFGSSAEVVPLTVLLDGETFW